MKINESIRIRYTLILVFTLSNIVLGFTQNENTIEKYYYYKGKKFYIDVDYSRISIVSEGKISLNLIKNLISVSDVGIKNQNKSYTKQNIIETDKGNNMDHNVDIYTTEIDFPFKINSDEYLANIQNLQTEDAVVKASPTYKVKNKKLGVSNNFYVKLLKAEDIIFLTDMAKKYSLQILGYNQFMPLWYTLSCTKQTHYNAVELANIFYESMLFESSEPEFLYHDLAATNDPFYSSQWGLNNTGQYGGTPSIDINAEEAWNVTTGSSNIKVAVFDHGFEMNHPDLQNNVYETGYDATTGTCPALVRGDHGTACTGIVGAQRNNSTGISGVAPSTGLMSISINLFFSDTPQQLANGFNWAWQNGADVISNSWGGYTPSTIIDNAISTTIANGRNGKGTVVVFAAGNEDDTNIRYPGVSNPDILVVGAASPCGERKNPYSCDGENWGSCYGTQLDIVAPGVLIPTTDRQGTAGYNPNIPIHIWNGGTKIDADFANEDYTVWFNGTSSACPHVAGLAALILSRDSSLTVSQVRDLIESTAQKVGGYSYQTTSGRPNGTWNNEMGYGLIDAYAAVAAVCPTVNFTFQTVTNNTTVTGCIVNLQNVTVQNGANLSIEAERDVFINGTFDVQSGSSLDIE
jgi:subtilisin family serine protease